MYMAVREDFPRATIHADGNVPPVEACGDMGSTGADLSQQRALQSARLRYDREPPPVPLLPPHLRIVR